MAPSPLESNSIAPLQDGAHQKGKYITFPKLRRRRFAKEESGILPHDQLLSIARRPSPLLSNWPEDDNVQQRQQQQDKTTLIFLTHPVSGETGIRLACCRCSRESFRPPCKILSWDD